MAKLIGVKTLSDREIEFEGVRYVVTEGPAQLRDIAQSTEGYTDICQGGYYLVSSEGHGVTALTDDGEDAREIIYRRGDSPRILAYGVYAESFKFFRRADASQTPEAIRALIDAKKAEIAELEAQLAEAVRINIGEYVRVTGRGMDEEFAIGDIAEVSSFDEDDDDHPYMITDVLHAWRNEWVSADSIVKITPAEAKAALIAQVEEAFTSAA